MYRSTDTAAPGMKAPDSRESAVIHVQDADELRLAQMGMLPFPFTAAIEGCMFTVYQVTNRN